MNEMNFEQARFNMVEQQIRTWEVLDPKVLDVIKHTSREDYVPEDCRQLAYADINIPLDHTQVMMKPIIEARLLQALDIQPSDKILEIGTGSGYLTALLAQLGGQVISVEIDQGLMETAAERLAGKGFGNVTVLQGDAVNGWEQDAPYDVIAVTGSYPEAVPEALLHSLAVGGRLFTIIGESPLMEATLITRVGEQEWSREGLFETDMPSLLNVSRTQRFVL